MLRKIVLVGIVLAFVGGGYGYYMWNKKTPTTASRDLDITITSADLASQFDNAKHLGKVLAVKGKIATIETDNDVTNITLETDDPMVSISCEIEKGFNTTSSKVGDEVTVKGQCDGKLTDVVLTRCIVMK
jgi:tRNA_anti-like